MTQSDRVNSWSYLDVTWLIGRTDDWIVSDKLKDGRSRDVIIPDNPGFDIRNILYVRFKGNQSTKKLTKFYGSWRYHVWLGSPVETHHEVVIFKPIKINFPTLQPTHFNPRKSDRSPKRTSLSGLKAGEKEVQSSDVYLHIYSCGIRLYYYEIMTLWINKISSSNFRFTFSQTDLGGHAS